jgi:hypothetical protein
LCSSPSTPTQSCLLVSGVRVGGTHIEGFSTTPCVHRFNGTEDSWSRLVDLMPVGHLLDQSKMENAEGFLVELNVSHAVDVRANLQIYYTNEYAEWDQANGTLLVRGSAAPTIQVDDRTLAFSFQLVNPTEPRAPLVVTVIGESGTVKNIGICDDAIEAGCSRPRVPSTARTQLEGGVLSGRVLPTFLEFATVSEDSAVQAARNTITVRLKPLTSVDDYTAGSRVTIMGLRRSPLQSGSLIVASDRLEMNANWIMHQGRLEGRLTSQPSYPHAPLIFSFTLRNPAEPQEAVSPSARIAGGLQESFAWGRAALTCATSATCDGVFSGSVPMGLLISQAWERTREVGALNPVSFSFRANVPILTKPCSLVIEGLHLPSQPPGPVEMLGGEFYIQRKGNCTGSLRCSLLVDTTPPAGSISTKILLSVRVDCRRLDGIFSVSTCDEMPLTGTCSGSHESGSAMASLLSDVEVPSCDNSKATLLTVQGYGMLEVEAVYSIYYSYATTSIAEYSPTGTLSVTVVPDASSAASSAKDPFSIAFMIAASNAPGRVAARHPAIRIHFDGRSMAQSQKIHTAYDRGVLGSGQVRLPNVSFWDAGKDIPSDSLSFYPAGEESYLVVNSDMLNNIDKVTKITFKSVDLNQDTDRLFLIDGDSFVSSRVCKSDSLSLSLSLLPSLSPPSSPSSLLPVPPPSPLSLHSS